MLKKFILSVLMFGFVVSETGLYAQQSIQTCTLSILKKVDGSIKSLHPVVKFAGGLTCLIAISLIKKMWDEYIESKNPVTISQEKFVKDTNHLSYPLQRFLKDFATWTQEEKNSIQFHLKNGFRKIIISELNEERQVAYEGNLAQWLEDRIQDMDPNNQRMCVPPYSYKQLYLIYLKNCIEYLQQ